MGIGKKRVIAAMAAAVALGACAGGSGSGGFDISEAAAIRQAIESDECVARDTMLVCPVTEPGKDAPGPERIDAALAVAEPVPCEEAAGACTFHPTFVPDGFPEGARFSIASRESDADPWHVEPPVELAAGAPSDLSGQIAVPESDAASGVSSVQFAVLVFLAPREIPSGPIFELSSTFADFVFVTDLLPARATASAPGR